MCMCTITVREFCVYWVISCIPQKYACALISMLTVNCTLIQYVYSSILVMVYNVDGLCWDKVHILSSVCRRSYGMT